MVKKDDYHPSSHRLESMCCWIISPFHSQVTTVLFSHLFRWWCQYLLYDGPEYKHSNYTRY